MSFIANLPTWNRLVSIYRTIDATAGNTLRGAITGQIYAAFKRATPVCATCQINFLWPYDTELIIHPSITLPQVGGEAQHDIAVFPWPDSPFENGSFISRIEGVGPRYEGFANRHNIATLHMESLTNVELWFPAPPPPPGDWNVATTTIGNGECTDCADLNSFSQLASIGGDVWETDALEWTCVGEDVILRLELTGPNLVLYLNGVTTSTTYCFWFGTISGWDGVSNINLTRGAEFPLCDFIDPAILVPV